MSLGGEKDNMPISHVQKHKIGDLLNARNPFLIPKHQRAYSWEDTDIDIFCDDLDTLASAGQEEYFFGGIVSVFEHASNGPGRIYSIVDGQQRLTTFTLLLALLRNVYNDLQQQAKGVDPDLETTLDFRKRRIEDEFLTYNDLSSIPPKKQNRLTLSKLDDPIYRALLASVTPSITNVTPVAESHRRLLSAWNDIRERLIEPRISGNNTLKNKADALFKIEDTLLEVCVVLHIVCDKQSEAYQLFEVLNDRGRDLATGDYLRANTLELLDQFTVLQDEVHQYWDDILQKPHSTEYLKVYLLSKKGNIQRGKMLHTVFRSAFFLYNSPVNNTAAHALRDKVKDIHTFQAVYEDIRSGEWPYANPTKTRWYRERLHMLVNYLDHTMCIPLLLSAYETQTEDMFSQIVCALERVAFRYVTVGARRVNKLSNIYSRTNNELRGNAFSITKFKNELSTLLMSDTPDTTFKDDLERQLVYTNSKVAKNKIRYFLSTLEYYNTWYTRGHHGNPRPDTTTTFNFDSLSIEHIYPRNPGGATVTVALEPVKNSIGNLTLFGENDNRTVSNNPFSVKKSIYAQSSLSLTRDLASLSAWDFAEYQTRLNMLKDMAVLIFRV